MKRRSRGDAVVRGLCLLAMAWPLILGAFLLARSLH